MTIRFHPHALERMQERGATEDEVKAQLRKDRASRRSSGVSDSVAIFRLMENGEVNTIGPNK